MDLTITNKKVCLCDLPLEVQDAPGPLAIDDQVSVQHHQTLDSLLTLEVNFNTLICLNILKEC